MVTKKNVVAVIAGSAFALSILGPLSVQAASLTSVQISAITNLLQAFGADSATIANVQSVLEGNAPAASTTTPGIQLPPASAEGSLHASACSVLGGNLRIGSEGEDVSRLQAFLAKDKAVYPAGSVTGYFGPMTEDAVRRWQAAHNVVSAGTPATTGYGAVGPHTRGELNKEMEMECEGGDQGASNGSDNQSASSTVSESASSSGEGTASSTSVSSDN